MTVHTCSVLTDPLWPHGLWPTRLVCPWNFPGKNTGVCCHFPLQGIFPTQALNACIGRHILYCCTTWGTFSQLCCTVLSRVQLFETPWTVACQASLFMLILQARILEWVALLSSRGSSQPRNWTQVSCTAGGFFTVWTTREALIFFDYLFIFACVLVACSLIIVEHRLL